MRTLVILCTLLAASQAFDLGAEEWSTYKLTHRKSYDSDIEEKLRMKIFMENRHMIAKHNQRFEMGLVSYKLGINKYADMLHHEFVRTFNCINRPSNKLQLGTLHKPQKLTFIPDANVQIPDAVDWREKGAVTPVKDQGQCGSCWSFSATGALEGQHFRKSGKLNSLSEQNLIDCTTKYGTYGCNGGWMDRAFQYIKDNGGIDTEKSYPYEGVDGKCRYNASNSGADVTGFVDIESGNEEKLKHAVATVGPVSVAINASPDTFMFYSKGVYIEPECSSDQMNHGVLVVGYGTDDKSGQDYWIVKNSWGSTWGEQGYMKMARNKDNQCGIATAASYPLV